MAGYGPNRSNTDTFTTGDTIKAAHLNDEFNDLLAAFHKTTGHSHDGSTDGEGAAITSLPANCTVPDTGDDTLDCSTDELAAPPM